MFTGCVIRPATLRSYARSAGFDRITAGKPVALGNGSSAN